MSAHTPGLTPAESERLAILQEECAEVIAIISKIERHGFDSNNNGRMRCTNRALLAEELGDLLYSIRWLQDEADVSALLLQDSYESRAERMAPYLHHQAEEAAGQPPAEVPHG